MGQEVVIIKEKYFSVIEEFMGETSARKLIRSAFKQIKLNKENKVVLIVSTILAIGFAVKIGWYGNAVSMSLSASAFLFSALLPIFGFLFTIYSLLLAFMNEDYIRELAEIEHDGEVSYLMESISHYESILFLYFIGVGITGCLYLYLNCINANFELTSFRMLNNVLSTFLLFLYFFYVIRIFIELKSTIFNTILLFRASVAFKLLLIIKRKESKHGNDDSH